MPRAFVQGAAQLFGKKLGKAINVAERGAKVVGDRIGKCLQLFVGRCEFGGALRNPPFQLCV